MTLETIAATVRRGGHVLFAVPRRDVADQLGRRLQSALAGVETVTLRGGTPHAYDDARVVVSTVHQTIRFCERFDLIIVDEVDAFPLNCEVWLLGALERAKRPGGRFVLMTATPPERLLQRIGKGGLHCLTLPGRPHGRPLPVPEIVLEPSLERDGTQRESHSGRSPRWLGSLDVLVQESLRRGRRVLLFVPSVRLTKTLAGLLLGAGPYRLYRPSGPPGSPRSVRRPRRLPPPGSSRSTGSPAVAGAPESAEPSHGADSPRYTLAAVHAGDGERTQKVAALEAGRIDLLVSTSILERGVTLPLLDVVVFAADWERVFDATALVQMAGRVGRSSKDPSGHVVFFAQSTTPAMREAIATIRRFNEIAHGTTSHF